MARRRLLSDEQLAPFWAWASDERAIVRHYTLSWADLDLIAKKRTASNQLGFAMLMCGMRFRGRVLDLTETPPAVVLAFIADQVGATPAQFATYRQRPPNRREHVAELMASLGCRAFDTDAYRELLALAVSLAQDTPRAERLVQSVIDEARSRHILLPTRRATLTGACTAMIRARENRDDPFIAIERQMKMGWSQFVTFVTETAATSRERSCLWMVASHKFRGGGAWHGQSTLGRELIYTPVGLACERPLRLR